MYSFTPPRNIVYVMTPPQSVSPLISSSPGSYRSMPSPERQRSNSFTMRISRTTQVRPVASTPMDILVHIDFKGAPPKVDYLKSLFPWLKNWGATGLLLEWEDMLPYRGQFEILKSRTAYSEDEVLDILEAARLCQLQIIPLVQTFGHLEYVLKHSEFAELREQVNNTCALCPLHSDSARVIKELIDEFVSLHQGYIDGLHIGGDEVWNLGTCKRCITSGLSKDDLFLKHMEPIIEHAKSCLSSVVKNMGTTSRSGGRTSVDSDSSMDPPLKPITATTSSVSSSSSNSSTHCDSVIMWDDMMRHWQTGQLVRLQRLGVVPMVWSYQEAMESIFPLGMWERYEQVFGRVYGASAFKGATEPHTCWVPAAKHLANNAQWLERSRRTPLCGVAVTGWARFDHGSALCELLPVAVPSLALCLTLLRTGRLSIPDRVSVLKALGLDGPDIDLDLEVGKGITPHTGMHPGPESVHVSPDFPPPLAFLPAPLNAPPYPGADVFPLVARLHWAYALLARASLWKAQFLPFQRPDVTRRNPSKTELVSRFASKAHQLLVQLKDEIPAVLSSYMFEDDIEEFVEEKITSHLNTASAIVKDIEQL